MVFLNLHSGSKARLFFHRKHVSRRRVGRSSATVQPTESEVQFKLCVDHL
jgi:hypothetical protein